MLRGMQHSLEEADITDLAASTHGFVGADMAALCQEATMCALRRVVRRRSTPAQPSQAHPAASDTASKVHGLIFCLVHTGPPSSCLVHEVYTRTHNLISARGPCCSGPVE